MGKNLNIIETLQNKCVRTITFSDFRSSANPIYKTLGLIKVNDIIKLQQLKLAYEYFDNILPDDLCQLFTKSNEMQSTNLTLSSSRNNTLSLPSIQTEHSGRKSLKFQCAYLWNHYSCNNIQLDDKQFLNHKKITNVSLFKKLLKKHFKFTYTLL